MRDRYYFFKGRVALYAILKAMGTGKGDEIILPGFTCVVVPNAVTYLGAKAVYADINPAVFNIDPRCIEERITGRTKAIIVQHTFGIPAEMDSIRDIAKSRGLYVIEDSCHALGSKYRGQEVGNLGDAAFFSAQWSKPVTTGLGGWATVSDPLMRKRMENIAPKFPAPPWREEALLGMQHFVYAMAFRPSLFWVLQDVYRLLSRAGITIGSSSDGELAGEMPEDYGKGMARWQIRLLEAKLSDSHGIIAHRRWVAGEYEKLLREIGIRTVSLPDHSDPVFLRYPVLVRNKREVLDIARRKKIEIGDWFLSPLHPNLSGWEIAGYEKGMCPKAEMICNHIVNLPTHQRIGLREIERAVDLVRPSLVDHRHAEEVRS